MKPFKAYRIYNDEGRIQGRFEDTMLEQLDPEFQKSLKIAAKEIRAGKGVSLQQYLKQRPSRRRTS